MKMRKMSNSWKAAGLLVSFLPLLMGAAKCSDDGLYDEPFCPKSSTWMIIPDTDDGVLTFGGGLYDLEANANYEVQTALLLPNDWDEVDVRAGDAAGRALVFGGNAVEFTPDDAAAERAELLRPSGPDRYWVGFLAPVHVGPDEGSADEVCMSIEFTIGHVASFGVETLVLMGALNGIPGALFEPVTVSNPIAAEATDWGSLKATFR